MFTLSTPLYEIRGIGPKFYERLEKFGLKSIKDLLWHFPFRYEDFSQIVKIADLKIGESATIQGVISNVKLHRTWRRRMFIVEALVSDDSGSVKAVWFNQRFLLSILKKGKLVNLAGKVASDPESGIVLTHPIYEIINPRESALESASIREPRHTARLVPIYPETKRVTSKMLRFTVKIALDNLEKLSDPVPAAVLKERGFPEINQALRDIHFPKNVKEARVARKRFAFEDLFFLQLANLRQRMALASEAAYAFPSDIEYIKNLLAELPFKLTQSQKVSLWEVLKDLSRPHPMNRLLQGDVGSGKTIVAAIAALMVAEENKQSAFMAPTEVLARQHYETFKKFFKDFDRGVALLTSGEAKIFYGDGLESETAKKDLRRNISEGLVGVVIGTHALIQKEVYFRNLAFVVIDEQHRFGVEQRAELTRGSKILPHFLSMSATPIPRTLSLTLFGDLDLSIISELPVGRKKIITKIVAPINRSKAYDFIRGQVKRGRQAFVICPRIESQNDADDSISKIKFQKSKILQAEVKAVKEEYEKLSQNIFPDLRVGLLHGKLRSKDKSEVMGKFKNGEIDILVSTSVVEVGVDVPNAAIMMIEGSDRFGLAQLYQFRGRVGRSEYQSFCLLFTDSSAKTTYQRLHSLVEAKNGFELAEKDLEIRGPGEFLGQSQTGLPDLAMKAVQNPELVKLSREAAETILKSAPDLNKHPLLRERLQEFEQEIHLE